MSNRLSATFDSLRGEGRAGFIPFLTAGDPSLDWSGRFVEALAAAGADVIELGVPFSDPIADGPVIQRSSERALANQTSLPRLLELVSVLRGRGVRIPIVLFTYFNPVLRMGLNEFTSLARASGVDGALIVDLPPEEAGSYREAMNRSQLDTVFLASPTTTDERLRLIGEASTGFVYYVSRLGVTGVRERTSASLADELMRVRSHMPLKPIAVGFGIGTAEQACEVAQQADAVVIGSALVKIIEDSPPEAAAERLASLTSEVVAALRSAGRRIGESGNFATSVE